MANYVRISDYKDGYVFNESLADQDTLLFDITIKRCVSITRKDDYPGDTPEIVRKKIIVRAEVKPITLGEIDHSGGLLVSGDLMLRSPVEIRGPQQKDNLFGDKVNPTTVADIIEIDAPYQGDWYAVGIPEPVQLNSGQDVLFWNANIRRIKKGAAGK